jgi:MFS family permease
VSAFDVQRFLGFTDAQLGLLLAATVVGGVAANASGGVLAERHGTRAALSTALVVWGVLLALTAAMTHAAAFCALFLVMVAAGGLVDVVMNVAGTAALGEQPVRLLRLHALFNGGALLGAAIAGVLLNAGVSFRAVWAGIAVLALVLAAWVRTAELPAGERGEAHTMRQGIAAIRRAGIATLAIVFALGAMVEGGIGTWGVLFLRSRLGLAAVAGAAAYVIGQGLATTTRSTLGWTAAHVGEQRGAQLGLALAGAGLLVEATAHATAPAAIGLAAAAVGSSVYWPLLLAHASKGLERPGVVVGGLSAAGYVGFLAGTPIVGWISDASDLRWGIAALGFVALAGAVIPIRSTGQRDRPTTSAADRSPSTM